MNRECLCDEWRCHDAGWLVQPHVLGADRRCGGVCVDHFGYYAGRAGGGSDTSAAGFVGSGFMFWHGAHIILPLLGA